MRDIFKCVRKKQVEVFPGKIKRHAKSYWIKVGFHSGRGESLFFGLNRYVPSEKGMYGFRDPES